MNWKVITLVAAVIGGMPAVISGWTLLINFAVDFDALSSMIDEYQDPQTSVIWNRLRAFEEADFFNDLDERITALEEQR